MNGSISSNLESLRISIETAARRAGRNGSEITLIGVTKTRSGEEVAEAIKAGLRDIGENRVQEAFEKKEFVRRILDGIPLEDKKVRWHLIGHLQSNKAARAAALFDVVHSIDSKRLAEKLGEEAVRAGRIIDCYVQVNMSQEATKFGVEPDEAESIVCAIVESPSLRFAGLMTIGPWSDDCLKIKSCFDTLRELRDRLNDLHPEFGKTGLSMGMSGDYQLAIEAGSTAVRIGTVIFGSRTTALL